MKKTIVAFSIVTLAASSAHAAIVAFEAESGTLGSQFDPALANIGASGGFYITRGLNNASSSTIPVSDPFTASYTFNLAAGTYDVYVRGFQSGSNDDSFFYAKAFGNADPTDGADWQLMNGGFIPLYTWAWSTNKLTATLTSPGGTVVWEIGAREDGFLIDSFAFVTSGQSVTATELDNALVPEPGSLALLGLGGVLIASRRRRG